MPASIGPYEIRSIVGSGGMGVVYEGFDPRLGRRVAVKTLRADLADNEEARRLFLREARAVAAVSHPHVTQIYFIGEDGPLVYFAMEFLEGRSLETVLQERRALPIRDALDLVRQAALGLKAAADIGIVHRDIKPSNLVLTEEGMLKVTDFGLAKQVFNEQSSQSTTFIATADYVAPERAAGQPLDLRSDIYSLGATLFELLTGRPPFQAATAVAVIAQHLKEPVPSLQSLRADVPYPVSSLVLKMLAKQPDARPQDYDALIRQLERLVESPLVSKNGAVKAAATEAATAPAATAKAGPSWMTVTVCAVVGLLIAAGVWHQMQSDDLSAGVAPLALAVPQSVAGGVRGNPADASGSDPQLAGSSAESVQDPAEPQDRTIAPPRQAPSAQPPSGSIAARASRHDSTAASGRSPREVESPAPRGKAELVVVDNQHEFLANGDLSISGEVHNVGGARAAAGKIKIALLDEAGVTIVSRTVALEPAILAPGERARFNVVLEGVESAGRMQFELLWLS